MLMGRMGYCVVLGVTHMTQTAGMLQVDIGSARAVGQEGLLPGVYRHRLHRRLHHGLATRT